MIEHISIKYSDGSLVGRYSTRSQTTRNFGFVYEGRMKTGVLSRQSVSFWPWGQSGSIDYSVITLDNADGNFDNLQIDLMRDGTVELERIVNDGTPLTGSPETVGKLNIESAEISARELKITVAPVISKLDRDTTHQIISGSNNGVADGLPVPITIGVCSSAPPLLIDAVNNVYVVSDGDVWNASTLEDRLSPLVSGTDYTSGFPETVTGGYYYDLASPADGTVTVKNLLGTNYSDTTDVSKRSHFMGNFYRRLLLEIGGIDPAMVDFTELDAYAAQPRNSALRFGAYISEPSNIFDIFQKSLDAWFGFVWFDSAGVMHFGQMGATANGHTIEDWAIVNQPRWWFDDAPALTDGVKFTKNWHVFSWDDVANIAGVTTADKIERTRDYRKIIVGDGTAFAPVYRDKSGSCPRPLQHCTFGPEQNLAWLKAEYANVKQFVSFSSLYTDAKLGDTVTLNWSRKIFFGTVVSVEQSEKYTTYTLWGNA